MAEVTVLTSLVQDQNSINLLVWGHPLQVVIVSNASSEEDQDLAVDNVSSEEEPITNAEDQDLAVGNISNEEEQDLAITNVEDHSNTKDQNLAINNGEDQGLDAEDQDLAVINTRDQDLTAKEEDQDSAILSLSSHSHGNLVVTASATRLLTGTSEALAVQVSAKESGQYVVTFNPEVIEMQDYSLAVLYKERHVKGSPFFLRFVESSAVSSTHTEKRQSVTDAGRPINLVIPWEGRGEVGVNVEGPFGSCQVDFKQHSWEEMESISIYFMPKGAGAYYITVTQDEDEIKDSPFLILADFSSEEAQECHVLPEDQWIFKKPLRFQAMGGATSFRISTDGALARSCGPGALTVLCSGPGKAAVKLTRDPEDVGLETCEVMPSVAGEYRLSILWKGQHISESPCVMQFKSPRNRIISDGLNLDQRVYELRVPYQFKLNCSELDGSAPEIQCDPEAAATVDVTLVEGSKCKYKCELMPLVEGNHLITIKYKGKHIAGSPFSVKFEDSSDPSACKVIKSSKHYEAGGSMSLKVSTKGAGPGNLEAMAEDPDSKIAISLATTKLFDDLYLLEFDPCQNALCNLSVTFNQRHIPGSPFRLAFSDPKNFKVSGDGLIGGRVGIWNNFMVQAIDPSHGELRVNVERDDGLKVETDVSSITPNQFEVKYLPRFPGSYNISTNWGQVPIPGFPVHVHCSTAEFDLREVPKKVEVGSQMEFKVHLTSGSVDKGGLEVFSRTLKGKEVKGEATLTDEEEHIYTCILTPQYPGKCIVGVKWNRLNIQGSPFVVRAVTTPRPDNVRVHGTGVEGGGIKVGEEVGFTIETAEAGSGLLAVKIRGPSRELKFKTSQDPENKRTLHACYCPMMSGLHTIEVEWAGHHVPGSPFRVDVEEERHVIVAELHSEDVAVDMECLENDSNNGDKDTQDVNTPIHLEEMSEQEKTWDMRDVNPPIPSEQLSQSMEQKEPSDVTSIPVSSMSGEPATEVGAAGGEGGITSTVSVQIEDRDSAYASSNKRSGVVQKGPPSSSKRLLPQQDSIDSVSSLNLYNVSQSDIRRGSADKISIVLEGEGPF